MGELYRRLKAYSETDEYPYHMPGHKRQVCGELPQEIMNIDITEIDGFDNLHALSSGKSASQCTEGIPSHSQGKRYYKKTYVAANNLRSSHVS